MAHCHQPLRQRARILIVGHIPITTEVNLILQNFDLQQAVMFAVLSGVYRPPRAPSSETCRGIKGCAVSDLNAAYIAHTLCTPIYIAEVRFCNRCLFLQFAAIAPKGCFLARKAPAVFPAIFATRSRLMYFFLAMFRIIPYFG